MVNTVILQPNSSSMSKGDNSLPTFHLPEPIVSYIPCTAINPYPVPLTLTNILFYKIFMHKIILYLLHWYLLKCALKLKTTHAFHIL